MRNHLQSSLVVGTQLTLNILDPRLGIERHLRIVVVIFEPLNKLFLAFVEGQRGNLVLESVNDLSQNLGSGRQLWLLPSFHVHLVGSDIMRLDVEIYFRPSSQGLVFD